MGWRAPRQFAAALTLAEVKKRLAAGNTILAAAWDAGLSGGSRAHDLFVGFDAATPGDFCRRGGGMHLWFGTAGTFLGTVFVAGTERGISLLRFADNARSVENNTAEFALNSCADGHWRKYAPIIKVQLKLLMPYLPRIIRFRWRFPAPTFRLMFGGRCWRYRPVALPVMARWRGLLVVPKRCARSDGRRRRIRWRC